MTTDFDVAVLGGGSAGLTAAGLSAHLGASTLLVERDRLGGDCTWTGCIPSKSLLYAAHSVESIRKARGFGIETGKIEVDFAKVMNHVRSIRQRVYTDADAPEHFEAMGVAVRRGSARFVDEHTLSITGAGPEETVRARYIIVATGAAPSMPPIGGLAEMDALTNETVFEIEDQPSHLIILGAGRTGIETAQAFRRLGSAVTVVDVADRILQEDDPEPAAVLREHLEAEGVRFELGAEIERVSRTGGEVVVDLSDRPALTGERLLVSTGRQPNLDGLDLQAAGVRYSAEGIRVDDRCRTSVSHIYAVGDVCGGPGFTHFAEHTAKIAVMNALLKVSPGVDRLHIPWVTYTQPELAHVGASIRQLEKRGKRYEVYRFPYERLDRAVTDDAASGFVVIYATQWRGKILGASIVGPRAGETISEVAIAMRNGVSLRRLSDTIHPYPTYGLGVRRAADQWYVRRRSSRGVRMLKRLFGYRGRVLDLGPDEIL